MRHLPQYSIGLRNILIAASAGIIGTLVAAIVAVILAV